MMPIFIFWLSAARAARAVSGTTPRAAATPATLSRSRRQRSGLPRTLISVSRIGNDRYPEAEDILFLRLVHPQVLLPERRPGAVSRTPGVPHRSQVQRVILTRSRRWSTAAFRKLNCDHATAAAAGGRVCPGGRRV